MASLSSKAGAHSLQWYDAAGRRSTLYLGKSPKRWAEEFRRRLERLVDAQQFDEPLDRATTRWLADLAPKWRAKLAAKGLAESAPVGTLEEMLDYQRRRAEDRGLEGSTLTKYDDAAANLIEFFGGDRPIGKITESDAEQFRAWMGRYANRRVKGGGPLAPTTADKRCEHISGLFKHAEDQNWIAGNPFAGMAHANTSNPDRFYFVDRETTTQVFEATAPGPTRLAFALARWAGVRVPSELRPLRWEWVDWDQRVLTVFDQKRKRYPKKRWRHVPIFPELMPYLREAWEAAPAGAEFLFSEHDREVSNTAWRNRLEKLLVRAKVTQWENLWKNLRSTRETELLDEFPLHVVVAWIGNSKEVAMRHYGQITKEHLARATGQPLAPAGNLPKSSSSAPPQNPAG